MKKLGFLSVFLCVPALFVACSVNEPAQDVSKYLEKIAEYELNIPEPSGLTIDKNSNSLWTVSDHNHTIYQIDLEGNILFSKQIETSYSDFEGIAFDHDDNTLWICDESENTLLHVSRIGALISTHQIPITSSDNSGLEGIGLDDNSNICLLQEKNPGKFIQLAEDLSIKEEISLDFAADYSGIYFDFQKEGFWMVSDQDENLFFWKKEEGLIESYNVNFPKAEGIVFYDNKFFIVSDSMEKLFVLKIMEK